MIARRRLLQASPGLLAAPALLRPSTARAQEVTLRLHHFLPPMANVPRHFLTPWARKVEKDSDNRIRVQIFPSMQLGGAPPQLYDQARDGVADLIWTLPGYTPNRFPRLEAFELPFVADSRAAVNARAAQEFAEAHLAEELREVRPIAVWAHDGGLIHANRPVATMEDLRGLKLRFPTRMAGEALTALGASPIGMPVPQVPEALSQRVLDGAVVPWEVVPSIKLQELVRYHTAIPGSPTFYSATNILAMNRARYESLPAELRQVIDRNSGIEAAAAAALPYDEQARSVEEMARKRGNQIGTISEAEKKRWMEATQPVTDSWIKGMDARGIDGAALLASARALIAKHAAALG
ncbi:TRAP transporter substrate-binding protein [Roseomonas marmotae]|uniref:TRAP transporter substrate-binding protein n=1 Tax=Roseomonas marmotae TaxID=2768161 RepID=A0ABS3KFN1_9PROT|nr:TRAP transporter substrate-binding protein [Roseomonas marmotae]MBO1076284.1 TRAP transporter substrate-binding protein [Roseomonas marmotae]QTI77837.1 TRAP transporter substrate-binding protein [Roseomonas marmotae]